VMPANHVYDDGFLVVDGQHRATAYLQFFEQPRNDAFGPFFMEVFDCIVDWLPAAITGLKDLILSRKRLDKPKAFGNPRYRFNIRISSAAARPLPLRI
jgi:hypothetical protein